MNKPAHVSELHVQGEWTHLVPQSPDLVDYLRKNSGVKDVPEDRGQKSVITSQRPRPYSGTRKDSDFLIIPPSIRPISAHFSLNAACCCGEIYPHCLAKSKDESVSAFSPSQSVNLLTKCAA